MRTMPVMRQMHQMAMQMGHRAQPPCAFVSELMRDFNVKQVEMTADKIPDDIKLLVVIHPKGISETTQYALDQFVLRGGKLVAFLDPLCILDRPPTEPGRMAPPSSSNLDKLLRTWGVSYDTSPVVREWW